MERDYSLDLIRVFAMTLIVFMHSPIPGSAPGFVLSGLSYATVPGIGLFFMVSGSLLLDNNLSQKDFLKRRFSKIIWPTLIWTIVYLLFEYIEKPISASELIRKVCSIPFEKQGHGVLWFMYTLAGLYMLTPVLSKWLKNATKREVEFYLFLWTISICYPYLDLVGLSINEDKEGILYYFSGYLGYFLLGYYLKRHYKYRNWHVAIAILIGILFPSVILITHIEFDFYQLFGYLTLPTACLSFAYWNYLNCIRIKREIKSLTITSQLCFGIYLVHILIIRNLIWKLSFINYIPGVISISIIAITAFILSWVMCFIIKKFNISKYIIGA